MTLSITNVPEQRRQLLNSATLNPAESRDEIQALRQALNV